MPTKTLTEQPRIIDESMGRQLTNESISASEQLLTVLLSSFQSLHRTALSSSEPLHLLRRMLTTLSGLTSEVAISMRLYSEPGTTLGSASPSKGKSSPEASPPLSLLSEFEKWSCACGDQP